jgi:hypothetical protein
MGWGESASEAAARKYGENQRQKSKDIGAHAREERNWENKRDTFNAEQRNAYREGRPAIYNSPSDVPDMYPAESKESSSPEVAVATVLLVLIFIVPLVFGAIGTFFGGVVAAIFNIISLIFWVIFWTLVVGVAAVTVVWLIKRHNAAGDEAKLKAARMWNPWNIARASSGMAIDAIKARRARK